MAHIYFGLDYELPSFETFALTIEEIKQFEGVYSGENFPLILNISEENGKVIGQAEGQPSFPLEAYDSNKFRFDRFGLKVEVNTKENKMIFKQGTKAFELKRA